MKKKSFVLCLLLLVLSLSSCKKKVELEEKEYWQGSIDDDIVDDTICVKIDKNFSNREFTVEDFKEINAIECKLSGSYPETIGEESFMRDWYTIILPIHSKQNVIDCIRIIREYDFVKYAEPDGYGYGHIDSSNNL